MSIFKACDIRGKFGEELDESIAFKIGRATGTVLKGKKIVVGGDLRPSTEILKAAVINGLVKSGSNVIDIGIVPTPVFYFAIKYLGGDGGLQITGSHNPPSDNGMKLVLGKKPVTPQDIEKIRDITLSENFVEGHGVSISKDIIDEYKTYIKSFFKQGKLKIVVDAGNGCYWKIAPDVLKESGYCVVKLFCQPDGTFPMRPPNPAIFENLKKLQQVVISAKADFGVAYDGDGDRAIFVDDNGNIVPADIAIVIFIRDIFSQKKGKMAVVYDIKCSQIVRDEIEKNGGIAIMEKSGHAFIKSRFLETSSVFAGEVSGHYFFSEIGGDDGLFATLKMAEIIQKYGPLSQQIKTIPVYAITPDIRIPVKNPEEILEKIMKHYPLHMVSTLDGVRIQFENGWALIRKSVTEPLITMRFEGKNSSELEKIKNEIISIVPEIKHLIKK